MATACRGPRRRDRLTMYDPAIDPKRSKGKDVPADTTVRLHMASRKSSCRTPVWDLKRRERISLRVAFASSVHSCTLLCMKCVSILFLYHTCSQTLLDSGTNVQLAHLPHPRSSSLVETRSHLIHVRHHVAQYGTVIAFDGKSDKYTGAPLGIVSISVSMS